MERNRTSFMAHTYRFMEGWRVCAGTRVYRGCSRGWVGRDQSEASILYPSEYLERMPHVRGVVWGYPCSNAPSFLSFSFPPFFFLSFFFFFSRPLHSTAILICLEFAFHAATTTCTPGCCPRGVEQVVIFLFLIFKISRVFLFLRFFSCKILFFFFTYVIQTGKRKILIKIR